MSHKSPKYLTLGNHLSSAMFRRNYKFLQLSLIEKIERQTDRRTDSVQRVMRSAGRASYPAYGENILWRTVVAGDVCPFTEQLIQLGRMVSAMY